MLHGMEPKFGRSRLLPVPGGSKREAPQGALRGGGAAAVMTSS